MKRIRQCRIVAIFLCAVWMLQACSSTGELADTFDRDNQREYGFNGTYVGQSIKETMEILQPTRADFMDMLTRESYTVDQMAAGAGETVMGMLQIGRTQVILKVERGVVHSIMLAGVPQEEAEQFRTNRGLAMYDSREELESMYGEASGGEQVVYTGKGGSASFGIVNNEVVWFRFDHL